MAESWGDGVILEGDDLDGAGAHTDAAAAAAVRLEDGEVFVVHFNGAEGALLGAAAALGAAGQAGLGQGEVAGRGGGWRRRR